VGLFMWDLRLPLLCTSGLRSSGTWYNVCWYSNQQTLHHIPEQREKTKASSVRTGLFCFWRTKWKLTQISY
jgi:hypothetical protein